MRQGSMYSTGRPHRIILSQSSLSSCQMRCLNTASSVSAALVSRPSGSATTQVSPSRRATDLLQAFEVCVHADVGPSGCSCSCQFWNKMSSRVLFILPLITYAMCTCDRPPRYPPSRHALLRGAHKVGTDGCRQELHCDARHGLAAFVLSLTHWEQRRFSGGETHLLSDLATNFWQHYDVDTVIQRDKLMRFVEPHFNQLTVFDPRIPHGVNEVRGTQDPLQARLVLHGWFVEPGASLPAVEQDIECCSRKLHLHSTCCAEHARCM